MKPLDRLVDLQLRKAAVSSVACDSNFGSARLVIRGGGSGANRRGDPEYAGGDRGATRVAVIRRPAAAPAEVMVAPMTAPAAMGEMTAMAEMTAVPTVKAAAAEMAELRHRSLICPGARTRDAVAFAHRTSARTDS